MKDKGKWVHIAVLNFNAATLFSPDPHGAALAFKQYLDSKGLITEPAFTSERRDMLEGWMTRPGADYSEEKKQDMRTGAMMLSERLVWIRNKNPMDFVKAATIENELREQFLDRSRPPAMIRITLHEDKQTEDSDKDLFVLTWKHIRADKSKISAWLDNIYKHNNP